MPITRTIAGVVLFMGLMLLGLAVSSAATWQRTVEAVYHTPVCSPTAVNGLTAVPVTVTGFPAGGERTNITDATALVAARALQARTCTLIWGRINWAFWMAVACAIGASTLVVYNATVLMGGDEHVGLRWYYMFNIGLTFGVSFAAGIGAGLFWYGGVAELNGMTPAPAAVERTAFTGACEILMYVTWGAAVFGVVCLDGLYRVHCAVVLAGADDGGYAAAAAHKRDDGYAPLGQALSDVHVVSCHMEATPLDRDEKNNAPGYWRPLGYGIDDYDRVYANGVSRRTTTNMAY